MLLLRYCGPFVCGLTRTSYAHSHVKTKANLVIYILAYDVCDSVLDNGNLLNYARVVRIDDLSGDR
jgi:hypothetical protein